MRRHSIQEVTPISQILSGRVPFSQYSFVALVMAVTFRHERPPKEPQESLQGVSYAKYWEIAEACWDVEARNRPTMASTVSKWQSAMEVESYRYAPSPHWPDLSEFHSARLSEHANAHYDGYKLHFEEASLQNVITKYWKIIFRHIVGHPDHATRLTNLGDALYSRYHLDHEISDLVDAITLYREAVQLSSLSDPRCPSRLNDLESALGSPVRSRWRYPRRHRRYHAEQRIQRAAAGFVFQRRHGALGWTRPRGQGCQSLIICRHFGDGYR